MPPPNFHTARKFFGLSIRRDQVDLANNQSSKSLYCSVVRFLLNCFQLDERREGGGQSLTSFAFLQRLIDLLITKLLSCSYTSTVQYLPGYLRQRFIYWLITESRSCALYMRGQDWKVWTVRVGTFFSNWSIFNSLGHFLALYQRTERYHTE